LKKGCNEIPQEFIRVVNILLRTNERLAGDADPDPQEVAGFEQAKREYTAEVEAYVRKAAKHGGTHKPQGDEIRLLQVRATERCASALEGILDVMRVKVSNSYQSFRRRSNVVQEGLPPLGVLDAQSDSEPESDGNEERELASPSI
jgi:hypothetical protein